MNLSKTLLVALMVGGFTVPMTAEASDISRARRALKRAASQARKWPQCRDFITRQAGYLAVDLTEQSLLSSLKALDTLEMDARDLCPHHIRISLRQARAWLLRYQTHMNWAPLWTWNTVERAQASCDRGYAEACYVLGERYEQGRGVKKNLETAFKLYEKSCESSWAKACVAQGLLYRKGRGVEKDMAKAATLFKEGCGGKVAKGCFYYGLHMDAGEGVMANPIDAKKWFKKACNGGYKKACGKLKDPSKIGSPPGGDALQTEISL